MHIDLVIIAQQSIHEREIWPCEAKLARSQLWRRLPPYRRVVGLDGHFPLSSAVAEAVAAEKLPDSAYVLFLPHEELLPAPHCVERLLFFAGERQLCCAHSNLRPPPTPPDYLTLRGLERYEASLPASATIGPWQGELCAGSAGAFRQPSCWQHALFRDDAYYHDFSGYHSHRREEMVALLPNDCASLLDVGGGNGGFLAAVKERYPSCRTALVELSAAACVAAQMKGIDSVWHGDFLAFSSAERFDCIAFLDVLEHVTAPQAMLLQARRFLTPKGCIVASIPNVAHWSVIADLLEGRWDYAPAGIHCITHLRFFTRKGIEELFAECGFAIEAWQSAQAPPPPWFGLTSAAAHLEIETESLATVAWHLRARLLSLSNGY